MCNLKFCYLGDDGQTLERQVRHAAPHSLCRLVSARVALALLFSVSDGVRIAPACAAAPVPLQVSGPGRSATASSPSKERVDHVPLRTGIWEQSILRGSQVVDKPLQQKQQCAGASSFSPFPSFPSSENFGEFKADKVMVPDYVWRLADGRYLVKGGKGTSRAGDVVYGHVITLHGDDHYDDALTITTHAATHPLKHTYSGSGHWVAPCPKQ